MAKSLLALASFRIPISILTTPSSFSLLFSTPFSSLSPKTSKIKVFIEWLNNFKSSAVRLAELSFNKLTHRIPSNKLAIRIGVLKSSFIAS